MSDECGCECEGVSDECGCGGGGEAGGGGGDKCGSRINYYKASSKCIVRDLSNQRGPLVRESG